jgi:proteasome activator subunit 4
LLFVTQARFKELLGAPASRRRAAAPAPADPVVVLRKHGAALGLSAIILAYPYEVPDWMPELLVTLAEHASDPDPINKTIKKTFAEFKSKQFGQVDSPF